MNKKNVTIQYLKALAIVMVIDDHCGQKLGIMTSLFPYNSFYMPLFVFISGYLFKDTTLLENIKKALKRIFLPYVLVNVVGILLSRIFIELGLHWSAPLNIRTIFSCLFLNPISSMNGPAWYAIMYFWLFVAYSVIDCVFKKGNTLGQIVAFISLLGIGIVNIHLCRNGILDYELGNFIFDYRLLLVRTMFYLPFLHFGRMFRELENKLSIDASRYFYVAMICVMMNLVLLISIGQENIIFSATSNMRSFKSD